MRKILLAAIIALMPFAVIAQTIYPDYQDGKIWFRVKDDYRIQSSLSENPLKLPIGELPFLNGISKSHSITNLSRPFYAAKTSQILQRTYLLEFTDFASVGNIIESLKATGNIVYAERVPLDKECLTPNDPSYGSQWHLNTINAASAWNYFSTGSTIKIAIVDNAIDRNHQDLTGNLWTNPGEIASNNIDDDNNGYIDDINGYDVGDNDNNPNPLNSTWDHGTHCAGISSAKSNNAIGIASIGYSCKLVCVKATANSASSSSVTNGYDGVVYAVAAGADVISMSWGGTGSSTTAQNVITWAFNSGVVLVAAAGNNNSNSIFYPAGYTECIAVAATNSNDTKASFSNYGTWVDISAPGNNIYSTLPSNGYGNMSGTSMACPLVAGLAGLMLSLNPILSPTAIRNCIQNSATNINSMNSSYIGQLGSGRIDANASMTCIGSTLTLPPVAAFTANITTVTAGGSVQFANQSLYCYTGTTYAWTFAGGTPGTSTAQTPVAITYNTPGTYNVTLLVTNSNGNNTHVATGYITVTAAGGCTKVNLPAPTNWTPVNYYTGASVGQDGWINGVNINAEKQKAMYFDQSSQPYTTLNNVWVAFGLAYSSNPAKIVTCRVYDGSTGVPTTLLGSLSTTMGQIMNDVNGNYYTEFSFVNSPITLPVSKKFFVSMDLTNLNWASAHDTLSIVSNTNGQTTTPIPIWEQQSNNTWHQYTTAGSWNLSASLYIHPFLTGQNTVATFTQSAVSICEGAAITFNATGSTYQDTLLWYFPGGSPMTSNAIIPSTIYNTAGSYSAILYVVGGGCDLFDSAFVNITVNANPNVAITATPSSVCTGGTSNLLASGATSYVWSPPTGLSSTTTAATVSTPTSTITYNVQGTAANGCIGNSTVQIDVLASPVGIATISDTTICVNQSTVFDGSNSMDATSFSWTFPSGSPSTSNASSCTVTYAVAGNYSATLVVTNACGTNTVTTTQVAVGCTGIDATVISEPQVFFNQDMQALNFSFPTASGKYQLIIYDQLGQLVKTNSTSDVSMQWGMNDLSSGVYFIEITGVNGKTVSRFVK